MKSVARYDNGLIKSTAEFTDDGFLRCDAIVTRTGVFTYKNPDGTLRKELRHPDDVLLESSLNSMKMIPVTNDHPMERLVSPENAKYLSVGFTGENIRPDARYIFSNFVVTDGATIQEIINSGKKELSLGYTVDLVQEKGEYEGEDYDFRQTNIVYNHLSIVKSARAGSEARIALDENDGIEISQNEESNMTKRKVKIDEDEYMMEEPMAESVEHLLEVLKNLKDENERVKMEIEETEKKLEEKMASEDAAREEASSLLEENKTLKEEVEKKMDASEIDKKVRARLKLLKNAEAVLDSESLEKIDSISEMEVKKLIIKSRCKNANLDGKSDVYINARYDAVIEDLPKNNVIIHTKKDATKTDEKEVSAQKSRNEMINRMKNNYKFGGK